jgi:hypothetical protein
MACNPTPPSNNGSNYGNSVMECIDFNMLSIAVTMIAVHSGAIFISGS